MANVELYEQLRDQVGKLEDLDSAGEDAGEQLAQVEKIEKTLAELKAELTEAAAAVGEEI